MPYQSRHEEKQSAWLYRELARAEADPVKAKLFDALAVAAEDQATIWLAQWILFYIHAHARHE